MRVAAERATISREVWRREELSEAGKEGRGKPCSTLLPLTSFSTCSSEDTGSFLLAPSWRETKA